MDIIIQLYEHFFNDEMSTWQTLMIYIKKELRNLCKKKGGNGVYNVQFITSAYGAYGQTNFSQSFGAVGTCVKVKKNIALPGSIEGTNDDVNVVNGGQNGGQNGANDRNHVIEVDGGGDVV